MSLQAVQPLYQITVVCPLCGNDFRTSRVRPSFRKPVGKDSDFCGHYRGANPDYYVVRVCPYCGYSHTENFENKLSPPIKAEIRQKISSNWNMRDFSGERDWNTAMQAYKLALLCAQMAKEKPRVIAGLLHHIAWLYREKGDKEQEEKFLRFALEAYIEVFETESIDVNDARLMYIIGELHRRLKEYNEAVRWFARVVNDKRIMDAAMIKACREQWALTREDMLAETGQLPEEPKEGEF